MFENLSGRGIALGIGGLLLLTLLGTLGLLYLRADGDSAIPILSSAPSENPFGTPPDSEAYRLKPPTPPIYKAEETPKRVQKATSDEGAPVVQARTVPAPDLGVVDTELLPSFDTEPAPTVARSAAQSKTPTPSAVPKSDIVWLDIVRHARDRECQGVYRDEVMLAIEKGLREIQEDDPDTAAIVGIFFSTSEKACIEALFVTDRRQETYRLATLINLNTEKTLPLEDGEGNDTIVAGEYIGFAASGLAGGARFDGWPADLPWFPSTDIRFIQVVGGKGTMALSLPLPVEESYNFYANTLAALGWQVESSQEIATGPGERALVARREGSSPNSFTVLFSELSEGGSSATMVFEDQ